MRKPLSRCIGVCLALAVSGAGSFAFSGCSATTANTYTPPAICAQDNATGKYDSQILAVLPNPTGTGIVLQLANYAAIKSGAYKASDALAVLNDIDAALDAATSYGALATYVAGKLADANAAAGTQIFVSTGMLGSFTQAAPISACDAAIIKRHLANQRAIITALALSK